MFLAESQIRPATSVVRPRRVLTLALGGQPLWITSMRRSTPYSPRTSVAMNWDTATTASARVSASRTSAAYDLHSGGTSSAPYVQRRHDSTSLWTVNTTGTSTSAQAAAKWLAWITLGRRSRALAQPPQAFIETDVRCPAEVAVRFARITHVDRLVTRSPAVDLRVDCPSGESLQPRSQLVPDRNAVGWATAHVVDVARGLIDVPRGESEGADQVLDEQQVAHLFAIAVNGERPAGSGGQHEVSHPALILGPELAWSVDARHAKDDGSQTVDAGVVVDVLIGGALGTAIG